MSIFVQTMHASTRSEISCGTPNAAVYSNQGLVVRQLSYYRRDAGVVAQVRIHLQRYNRAGQLTSSVDPRLAGATLKNSSVIPNHRQQSTLSGQILKSDNVDAGTRVGFSDVRGQVLWSWDSRGTERAFDYDELRRVTAVHERERGKELLCRERCRYGEASEAEARCNCVGQLIEHLDTAGQRLIPACSLLGQVMGEERTFVKAEEVVHWTEEDTENTKLLEEQSYSSRLESNALGEVLTQIDAAHNARHTRYDIAGYVSQMALQLPGEGEKSLVHHRVYRARVNYKKKH